MPSRHISRITRLRSIEHMLLDLSDAREAILLAGEPRLSARLCRPLAGLHRSQRKMTLGVCSRSLPTRH